MNARDELRALLRAHLAASGGRRHLTRHCLLCNRLMRLAREAEREAAREAERRTERGSPPGAEGPSPA
ncbi:DUF6274 family protein [Streptomyces sp. NPDC098789]|uniref:DUF6274 family protein n=1 Tax=Streptomyces sp. NPDC098789 TaxID=3366098 RepID=UPI0037F79F3A